MTDEEIADAVRKSRANGSGQKLGAGVSVWHKRHADWERADRIEIQCVPRYKTSGLSGDEWRVGYQVRVFFKGALWVEFWRTGLDAAINHLQYELDKAAGEGLGPKFLEHEKARCYQQGCSREGTTTLALRKEYSSHGEELVPNESFVHYRRFCSWHLQRGDCGMEDADSNYIHVDGPTKPEPRADDESPSGFGGVIDLRREES